MIHERAYLRVPGIRERFSGSNQTTRAYFKHWANLLRKCDQLGSFVQRLPSVVAESERAA